MTQRTLLNYVGIAILLLGLGTAEFTYWRSLNGDSKVGGDSVSLESEREYERTMDTTVGTIGLIMKHFSDALGSLAQPGPLAILIGAFSLLAGGGCFLAASRMPRE